jgi:anaerobic magnesium-protoporphyrin IX monomethyl ester cyclase
MTGKHFPLVSYAVQSKGPVLSGLMLDNGPALMAAYLQNEGFIPTIFDYNTVDTVERIAKDGKGTFVENVKEELVDYVGTNDARVVGFKLYANGFSDSVQIAGELRRRYPHLMIVGAGPQVEWFEDAVYNHHPGMDRSPFDVLLKREGDLAITRFADLAYGGMTNLEDVPNSILPDGTRTINADMNLDNLPFPEYGRDVYRSVNDVDDKIHIPVVEDSRGCSYDKCVFCVHPRIGGKLRRRKVEKLAAEMEHTETCYGWKVFRLSGPGPTSKYINALSRIIPSDYRFSAFGYADVGYDFANVAKNLVAVFVGLESADPWTLKNILKKNPAPERYLDHAREMIWKFKDDGVVTIASVMISPGETRESMERTIKFLEETRPDFVNVLPMGPIPGVPIERTAREDREGSGIILDSDFVNQFMMYELDLLQPPERWPQPPWQAKYDGKFTNPFLPAKEFSTRMIKAGMLPYSDEIVLMTLLHNGNLRSQGQTEIRTQCNEFHGMMRKYLADGNAAGVRDAVMIMNKNVNASGD